MINEFELNLFNKTPIKPKDLILKMLDLKNNFKKEIKWFNFNFMLYNPENSRIKFVNYDKSLTLSYFYLSLDVESLETNKFIEYIKNLNIIDKEVFNSYSDTSILSFSSKAFEKRMLTFNIKDEFRGQNIDKRFLLSLEVGKENLNNDNLFELLTLYLKIQELKDMSDIKFFKTLFFGNISNKIFYPYLENLANQNKIIIDKSSSGAIKTISINDNINNTSKNLEIINKLKQNGVLKLETDIHWFTKSNIATLTIYGLIYYKYFKIELDYKNDKVTLNIYNDNFNYVYNLLELYNELNVIEKIKADLINNLLPQIEEKLGYPINKNLVLIDNKYIIENFLLKN